MSEKGIFVAKIFARIPNEGKPISSWASHVSIGIRTPGDRQVLRWGLVFGCLQLIGQLRQSPNEILRLVNWFRGRTSSDEAKEYTPEVYLSCYKLLHPGVRACLPLSDQGVL